MQLRSALLAATVLATPFAASAQPVTGLYVGGGAGVNITQKENVNGIQSAASRRCQGGTGSTNGNLNGSTGFVGLVIVGWGFGNGLRAEIEGNYRNNDGDGSPTATSLLFGVGGGTNEQKYGGMVNVLYDFNGVRPGRALFGAGVGYVGISAQWQRQQFGSRRPRLAAVAGGSNL